MKKIKKGSTIGIVAPASYTDFKNVFDAKKNLEDLGYNIILGNCTKKKWYSYAGEDRERANEINEFFSNKDVDIIMCMRGGYGCNRIVEYLDLEVIKANPKPFIGYSDITTLHILFNQKLDMVTFHGPMFVSNLKTGYNLETYRNFVEILSGEKRKIDNFSKELKVLVEGKATGKLVGGNLATLIATLGTEYDLDYEGKILFLEEIGEEPYKIDRFLNMLKKHGVFEKVNGVILGDFNDCNSSSENQMPLEEVIKDYLGNLKVPVIYNLESGHCEPMLTLPLGANISLDTEKMEIKIVDRVVE